MKKRFLCVLTILCLIFTMTPLGAFANTEPVKYNLWVGGVQVTSENANDVFGDGTVSYDNKEKTLMLVNANIDGVYKIQDPQSGTTTQVGILSLLEDLTIYHEYDNSISIPNGNKNTDSVGIFAYGDLDIRPWESVSNRTNKSSLSVTVGSAGYTSGIEVVGGNLMIIQNDRYDTDVTFSVVCGDATRTDSCAISTDGILRINVKNLTAIAGSGINSIAILNAKEKLDTDDMYQERYSKFWIQQNGIVRSSNARDVSAGIFFVNCNAEVKTKFEITSGDVSGKDSTTCGVAGENSNIELLGTFKIKAGNGGFSSGVMNPNGTLSMNLGNSEITAGNSGVDSEGNPWPSCGIIGGNVLMGSPSLVVSGGNTHPGGGSFGIFAAETTGRSGIAMSGGNLIAKGKDAAIYCAKEVEYANEGAGIISRHNFYEWRTSEDVRFASGWSVPITRTNCFTYMHIRANESAGRFRGKITRLAGIDRFGTSAEISKEVVGNADAKAIVIVDGLNFPDALAAVPFASQENAPILMVNGKTGEIKDTVLAEINRIDADHNAKVYIIGGDGAVTPKAVENLKKLGYKDIERVAGSDRYGTAIEVAKKVDAKTAFIACGLNYPDALGGGSAAASNDGVILFTATNYLTQSTKEYLIEEGFEKVVILGGTGAVSESVETEIKGICNDVTRISGKDRYDTSMQIALTYFDTTDHIFLATGASFADALAGGVLAGKLGGPIVLVNNYYADVPGVLKEYIAFKSIHNIVVLGGEGVVNSEIYTKIGNIVNGFAKS